MSADPAESMARVLVVDDDDLIRRSLATSLTRAGFNVTTADDGAPAIELSDTSQFELIVVDYNMKTTTGAEVVRHYKQRYGTRIFCVVLSGDDDELTRSSCASAGADAVMMKPTPVAELRRMLTTAVESLRVVAA